MTREEAIERLKTDIYKYADFTENPNENEFWMAFDMAIEALEQEPCEDWHDVPSDEMTLGQARQAVKDLRKFVMDNHILPKLQSCSDAISRQAVIDMTGLSEWFDSSDSYNEFVIALSELPPVTPTACIAKVTFDKDELQKIVDEKVKELTLTLEWIPVSEKSPEWGEEVLTINNDGDYEINHIIDDECNEWFYDNGIVAWMPLPEPYNAESER